MKYNNFGEMFGDYIRRTIAYRLNKPIVKPERVNLGLTYSCPLNCKMCHIPDLKYRPEEELRVEEWKRVIREIKEWGVNHITFAGGETLSRKEDSLELLNYANKLDIDTELITNGYYIDQKLGIELIESGVKTISISVDGASRKTHDEIRGNGSFERCIRAARSLESARNNEDTELEVTTVIMSPNHSELREIWELMHSLNFDFINYQALVPDNTFSGLGGIEPLWPKKEEIERLEKVIEQLIEIKEKTGEIRNKKRYLRLVPDYFRNREDFNPGNCMAGFNGLEINPYGEIDVCSFGPSLNVRDYSLKEIWHSEEFQKTRKRIKNCQRPCLMLCYEKMSLKDLLTDQKDALFSQRVGGD